MKAEEVMAVVLEELRKLRHSQDDQTVAVGDLPRSVKDLQAELGRDR